MGINEAEPPQTVRMNLAMLARRVGTSIASFVVVGSAAAPSCSSQESYYEDYDVIARVGSVSGPGILGDLPVDVRVFAGRIAVVSQRRVQLYHGDSVRQVGRIGRGPGEYILPLFVRFAPDSTIWVFDRVLGRAMSYSLDGEARDSMIDLGDLGHFYDPDFLPDGKLVVNASGMRPGNLGFLLHVYEGGSWRPVWPALRDSAFSVYDVGWRRSVSVVSSERVVTASPRGDVVAVDVGPTFRADTVLRSDLADFVSSAPDQPPVWSVRNIRADPERQVLWILWNAPDSRWDDAVVYTDEGEGGYRISEWDIYLDAVVEAVDLTTGALLDRWRFDSWLQYLVAPGVLSRYTGDLPYPAVELWSLDQEEWNVR